jgi:hypothetical protein
MVQQLALHPRILALAEAGLAPACDCMRLNMSQAIRIHPGQKAQAPHRDEEMWPADPNGRIWSLNVMWAVSDFTEIQWRDAALAAQSRRTLGSQSRSYNTRSKA